MQPDAPVRPTPESTAVLLAGCGVGWFLTQDVASAYKAARLVSFILLAAIGVGILLDLRKGLRNLVRVDIFALLALYFLLYFEFLFDQPRFELISIVGDIQEAIHLTLYGFAAIGIGRHFATKKRHPLDFLSEIRLGPNDYFVILLLAFVLANLHSWISVGFNPIEWFQGVLKPRFLQPWARGKYGDATALISELSLLGYTIPPLAGLIIAKRKIFRKQIVFAATCLLLFQSFVAFTGGTRNVLAVYIAGFIGTFLLGQEKLRIRNTFIYGVLAALLFIVLAKYMLEFRTVGLGQYIEREMYKPAYKEFSEQYLGDYEKEADGYFVDYNLYSISLLVPVFPEMNDFLGWNLPFVALTKPVPRVFWPSKPTDLKVGIEEAIGVQGYTVAVTYVGEAFMIAGMPTVWVAGILIGAFCAWWNRLAIHLNAPLALAVYSSGFYAVLITMRSLLFFTTAILPAMALLIYSAILYARRNGR